MKDYNKILKPNKVYLYYAIISIMCAICAMLYLKIDVIGLIFIIFTLILLAKYFLQIKSIKKCLKKYDDLESELSKDSTIIYKDAHIYLTDKYLISTYYSCVVLEYTDFIWVYDGYDIPERNSGDTSKKSLFARCKYTDFINLTTIPIEKIKILEDIMLNIKKKNPEVMIGDTKENLERYKQIVKNNKEMRKMEKNNK